MQNIQMAEEWNFSASNNVVYIPQLVLLDNQAENLNE